MSEIRLFLCGDVMTGRGIDQILTRPGDRTLYEPAVRSAERYVELAEQRSGPIPRRVDPTYIWGEASEILDRASVTARIINLETAVTDGGDPWPGKGIHYRMHPDNVETLRVAGLDCCVLANNHVLDWSYPGLAQTLDSLAGAGLRTAGAGPEAASASRPAVIPTGEGGRVIVVALGAPSSGISDAWAAGEDRPGVNLVDPASADAVEEVARSVASAAEPEDVVVASIHWGSNWGYDIPASHTRFARGLIDHAGVHVVHGHSSHHPLGIEIYRGRPILYGCGDLINDYEGIGGHEEYHPELGVLYLVALGPEDGRIVRLELVPMRMRRFRLEQAPPGEVVWLTDALTRAGRPFGTRIEAGETAPLQVRW